LKSSLANPSGEALWVYTQLHLRLLAEALDEPTNIAAARVSANRLCRIWASWPPTPLAEVDAGQLVRCGRRREGKGRQRGGNDEAGHVAETIEIGACNPGHRGLVDVPVVEPRLLRKVVVLPTVVAVPVVEPRESRNTVVLPLLVAVPMVEPRESRNVV
jgi:hypothetical protein